MHVAHARYRNADSDDALIAKFAPVIERTARRLVARTGAHDAYDDLWSAGAMGLLDAAGRFSEERHVRFESFVEHRIRGAMLDELRRLDHLPRRLRADVGRIARSRAALTRKLGRAPREDEIASDLDISVESVSELEAIASPPLPLEADLLRQSVEAGPDEATARNEIRAKLTNAVSQLPERLQTLLSLYYVEDLSYREIADLLGVSQPRICQLHGEALQQLRRLLAPAGGGQP